MICRSAVAGFVIAVLAACGGGGESGTAEAVCRQIDDGATAIQVFNSLDDIYGAGSEFAENLHGWMSDRCPEHLEDPGYAAYFAEHGID